MRAVGIGVVRGAKTLASFAPGYVARHQERKVPEGDGFRERVTSHAAHRQVSGFSAVRLGSLPQSAENRKRQRIANTAIADDSGGNW